MVLVIHINQHVNGSYTFDEILVSYLPDFQKLLVLDTQVLFDVNACLFEQQVFVLSYHIKGFFDHIVSVADQAHVVVKEAMRVFLPLDAVE